MSQIQKEFIFAKSAIDEKNRKIRFLASTPSIDRDGERVLPEAFEAHLPNFMINPVFLAGHQHRLSDGSPSVIGRVVKIWTDKVGLWIIVQFAKTGLAEEYWQLYSTGFMKAVSIGFIPKKWRDIIENGQRIREHTEIELIEISAVAVPANADALVRSKSRQKKLEFVQDKREAAEEKKILDEVRREFAEQGRDYDAECQEFAEALLFGDEWGNLPRKEKYAELFK